MKAINIKKYGDSSQIQIVEVDKPEPKKNEILIKQIATTVTSGDARIRALYVPSGFELIMRIIFGWTRPKGIPGGSFVGIVEKIGSDVTRFQKDDQVFGFREPGKGAHAEFLTIRSDAGVSKVTDKLDIQDHAAIAFGGNTSLYFLRDLGHIKKGDKVLINGASGSLGTAAIQIAKAFGAEVTAVSSKKNHKLLISIGTDHLVDYQNENIEELDIKFDIIYDAVGKLEYTKMQKNLNPNGKFLSAVAGMDEMLKSIFKSIFGYQKFKTGTAGATQENLEFIKSLIDQGIYKPVIGKEFDFVDIRKAHDYVDSGRKVGSVVVKF